MNIPNYAKETLLNNRPFIIEVTKSSEQLFSSIPDTFFNGNDRTIKVLRSKNNNGLYILDQHKKQLNVYWEKIEDFQQEQSIDEILQYTILRLKEHEINPKANDDGHLYLLPIFGTKKSQFLEQIENGTFEEEKDDSFEKKLHRMRNMGVEKSFIDKIIELHNLEENDPTLVIAKQYDLRCPIQVDILRDYTKLLQNQGFLTNQPTDKFFKELNQPGYSQRNETLPYLWEKTNYFIETCKNNDMTSYSKGFVYNDLDNTIFLHNNHLIMTDQSCGYYFDINNENNYKIYFLETEYNDVDEEIETIETALKNNTIDELKQVVLDVSNGETVFQNDVFMYVLELCIKVGEEEINKKMTHKKQSLKKY